jgi:hypothetical protein
MGLVFVLALATYVGAQYITYLDVLRKNDVSRGDVSFVRYFQIMSENMTFKEMDAEAKETELGKLGYAAQGLAALGFAFGAMIPVLILRHCSYCPACQLYMRSAGTFFVGSTGQVVDLRKRKKQEKKDAIAAAVAEVSEQNEALVARITEAPLDETIAALNELPRQTPTKALAYVQYNLHRCPHCDAHHISVTLSNQTIDNKRATTTLAKLPKARSKTQTLVGSRL